jgi:hypothetical protein
MDRRATVTTEPHRLPIGHLRQEDGPFYDAPLALVEAQSVRPEELVPSDLVYPNRVGETYNVLFSPAHRWHYIRQQAPDEVLLLKCYDSRTDAARFAPNRSFLEQDVPADAPRRKRIELRTLVFYKD